MKPFKLTARQLTSIVIGKRPPNLAGILYHCCLLHTGSQEKADSMLSELLMKSDGVYHASDLIFEVNESQHLIATEISTSCQMNSYRDLDGQYIKPFKKRGNGYKALQVQGGPYKFKVEKYKAYKGANVLFYGVGDATAILNLLNFYVGCIGKFSNIGIGNIGAWAMSLTDSDYSTFAPTYLNKKAMMLVNRLPVNSTKITTQCLNSTPELVDLSPPFNWKSNQRKGMCFMGQKINKSFEK